MAIVIPAEEGKSGYEIRPENGTDFRLSELYAVLSCSMIEILSIGDGLMMIIDEEGKLVGKPRNERATRLAHFVTPRQLVTELLQARERGENVIRVGEPITDEMIETDFIAGDVLICNDDEIQ